MVVSLHHDLAENGERLVLLHPEPSRLSFARQSTDNFPVWPRALCRARLGARARRGSRLNEKLEAKLANPPKFPFPRVLHHSRQRQGSHPRSSCAC